MRSEVLTCCFTVEKETKIMTQSNIGNDVQARPLQVQTIVSRVIFKSGAES